MAIICASAPMLKSLFVHFFEARSNSNSPEQGPTRHDYYQQQQFDVNSSSKLPTITTHEENAVELTRQELNEANAELQRLQTRNQGWALYKVNDSSQTPSELELERSAGGRRYGEANSASTVTTMTTTTRRSSRQESKGLIEVTTPAWDEASEMEMGRLFEAAQKLKRSR